MVYLMRVKFGTRFLCSWWLPGLAQLCSHSQPISAALVQGQPCRFQGAVRINWYPEKRVYLEEDTVISLEDTYKLSKPYGVRKLIVLCGGNNMNKISHLLCLASEKIV